MDKKALSTNLIVFGEKFGKVAALASLGQEAIRGTVGC
jgi:hypothetical protein